jgi:hypothetical protein
MAPHAPHGAACAAWRRMPPYEARRCLMKPDAPVQMGSWPRAASQKDQIHKIFAINYLRLIVFEKVPKRRQKAARRRAAESQVR